MAKLIGKLNVLVRSSINSVLGDEADRSSSRRGHPSLSRLGKDIDREIEALRQQINHALDDEDRQQVEMNALRQQIAGWDQQADKALSQGDEATARHAIRQMQTEQRRLTMLEAELAQHRIATSELIQRVNELEAVVAEARRRQAEAPTEEKETSGEGVSSRLRQARQNIEQQMTPPSQTDVPAVNVDESTVDDDLARRRARLSQ
jgi:phage shock protein A